jgi:hypothetical protein
MSGSWLNPAMTIPTSAPSLPMLLVEFGPRGLADLGADHAVRADIQALQHIEEIPVINGYGVFELPAPVKARLRARRPDRGGVQLPDIPRDRSGCRPVRRAPDGGRYRREGQAVGLDVIGEGVRRRIRTLLDLSSWWGSRSRMQRLIGTIPEHHGTDSQLSQIQVATGSRRT